MNFHKIFITIKENSYFQTPEFLGSTLRGALGISLKDVVCINPSKKCEGCFAVQNCLYFSFYETPNITHDFRLDFELGQKKPDFGIYLFNEAAKSAPYILSAAHKMLTQTGLGINRQVFEIERIEIDGEIAFAGGRFLKFSPKPQMYAKSDTFCQKVRVKFVTPLRIKKNNVYAREEIGIEDLFLGIARRNKELGMGDGKYRASGRKVCGGFIFKDFTRWSNRQKTKMLFGGLLGEMEIEELDKDGYNLLKMGEIVGVGKGGSFGMGKIKVEEIG